MARFQRASLVSSRALILLAAAATMLALVATAQSAAFLNYSGEPVPWLGLLKASLVNWYLYALFVPFLYWLAIVRPIDRRGWHMALPLHLVAGLVSAVVKEMLFVAIGDWFRPGVFRLQEILAGDYFDEVLFFWAIIAAIQAYLGWRRARSPEVQARCLDRFVINGAGGYRVIPVDDVRWIDAQGNYAQLNTTDGRHLVRNTMASLDRRLGDGFVRVHRGAIVNRAHIERIEPRSHGSYTLVLSGGDRIVTSRSYNRRLRTLFR